MRPDPDGCWSFVGSLALLKGHGRVNVPAGSSFPLGTSLGPLTVLGEGFSLVVEVLDFELMVANLVAVSGELLLHLLVLHSLLRQLLVQTLLVLFELQLFLDQCPVESLLFLKGVLDSLVHIVIS